MEKETNFPRTAMTPATKNKIVYGVIAVALIGLFLLGRSCGIKSVLKQTGSDTTIYRDSMVYRYKPVPYKVIHDSLIYVKGKPVLIPVHDTLPPLIENIIESVDTGKILEAYYMTSYYHNEIDTGRVRVIAEDTVTQNRITGKSLKVVSIDTSIHTTTVLKPPKNFVAYLTFSTMGNFNNPLYGQSIGLAFKTPADRVYQIGIARMGNHRPMAQISYFAPIKFHK